MVWINVQQRCMLTDCMAAVCNFVYAKCIDCIENLEYSVSHHEVRITSIQSWKRVKITKIINLRFIRDETKLAYYHDFSI